MSVSAEVFGKFNKKEDYVPPVHAKTAEQVAAIKQRMEGNFMFDTLNPVDTKAIIDAIEATSRKAGDVIIQQGDDGDNFYVVEEGLLTCTKRMKADDAEETFLKEYKPGESFGELALLYNAPRAATIVVKSDEVQLWSLDRNTFSNMSKRYPIVQPLHELRKTLGEFKLNNLAVGRDGRNRTLLSPLAAKTGRNQPSTTKFIFGPAKWIRGLIKPPEGSALAYCDWSSQEIAIAAALSDDNLLWAAYESGDPYIAFAIQAGLAPPGATKDTHKDIRNRCKSVVLGTNYGMSAYGVAQAAKIHELEAKALLQKHRETYRKFWAWAENNKDRGLLGLKLETCFGWPIQVTTGDVKANTFLNWPMQAHGAEMMRVASILATERGIKLCAPIHDALLIEAPVDQIDSEVVRLKECMSEASEAVLGEGKVCRVDADIVRHPDRYMDEHGQQMWDQIMILMDKTQG
jgi:hypothetical protein